MRPFRIGLIATALVAACGHVPTPVSAPAPVSSSAGPATVNPANIKRVGRELPPDYEVTSGLRGGVSPRVIWRLDGDATATPAPCGSLADLGSGVDQSAQGVSGSGAGGIIDAVVVAVSTGPAALDGNLVAECAQWTMSDPHTTASIRLTQPPRIDGVQTLGMVADIRTSVESGAEIATQAYTFIAYLGAYYAFTTLTTDPGSMGAPLAPQFAADLLVKTVSTLRS
ncbi:hypothetical protein MB901379_03943 [Mycobacterium basiliense]|uniref:DUF5642 domain-containing protein n=1 Tax=Mycobacterium basiliense TaxID=2094119 RepID=A0A447GIU9_9MYCO|nr:DUF5642 family protein [Mycobacterium basiliense]VDM90345.1 hypothetical protein MB901379_03943 [Mycobacterium basiliense]